MSANQSATTSDYDLDIPVPASASGLRQGLTSYGDAHFSLFLRKVFIKALGYSDDALSRPIIGIVNTYSSFNPCHANIPQLIEAVKRGVQLNGGLAIDFPTISLHESFASPTSMFLRNLMSMDTEEMIRAQPCDAAVLIGGCDKTTPAQLMGGISANKPIVHLVTGPMMPGSYKGARIGACTDCRNNWAKFRAGTINVEDISAINDELAPTVSKTKVLSNRTLNNILKAGTCGVMGTASTMACILVALGMMPFKGATAPAVSSARLRIAEESGKLAVDAAATRRVPKALLSRESFLNAMTVLQAIGGSTNAVVHLMAIIGRHPTVAGTIDLSTFDDIGRRTPLLVDLKPSGKNYMTDFHNSGGMLALLHALKPLLYLDVMTVSGKSLGEEIDSAPYARVPRSSPTNCLHSLADPLYPASSLVVLHGNLAPGGAVMKASASKDRTLLQHSGRAVVFVNSADLAARIDDPELDVDANSVLVLQNIGPVGNPGMPEAGLIPIPRKLSEKGVEDMLRLSDGRMSGTAGGTIVLHISPESSNPDSVLGVVQNGDMIECDVEKRLLHLRVSDEEIEQRIASRKLELEATVTASASHTRGYRGLYMRTVNQAQQGADFDFLTAAGPT
ncbi:unnamed protein product [Alternaria alternata]